MSTNNEGGGEPSELVKWLLSASQPGHFRRCYRCWRSTRLATPEEESDWMIRTPLNVVVGLVCPDCQSLEERADMAIKQATTRYRLEGMTVIEEPISFDDDDEPGDEGQNPRTA